jgi:putative hydrolase of the HAD superfamily
MTDPDTIVVFDLDDTLYFERDYVRSGFRAVADEIATTLPALREPSFAILCTDFDNGIRGSSFDRLASALPEVAAGLGVPRLIDLYRSHTPDIKPMPGAERLLRALRARQIDCGLITDGRERQQMAKLDALGLRPFFDGIIVNETSDRFKPDCRSFLQMQHRLGADRTRCWYVADNPSKDFIAPRQLGWKSIRLRKPMQLREHLAARPSEAADFTVGDLDAVLEFMATAADSNIACS